MATKINVNYGNDTIVVEWDGANASAPIVVDGEMTQYQTADAKHNTEKAVRIACGYMWGQVYESEEEAEDDGRGANDQICIWDYVSYAVVE